MAPAPRPRSPAARRALAACAGLVCTALAALGTWQLFRLHWKLDLIGKVEQRAHAPAVAAPGPGQWPAVSAGGDEYRRVRLSGDYLYPLTTKVQAVTALGSGFWLLTPLRAADGAIVLVNRGFVPAKASDYATPAPPPSPSSPPSPPRQEAREAARAEASGAAVPSAASSAPIRAPAGAPRTVVTGLLRVSEPGGGFLRHNAPAANRWYSRDVPAIAAARGLAPARVAPYFVDADAASAAADGGADGLRPVGGLTVIAFQNNHLVYAVTWYTLALMVAGACFWVVRADNKRERDGDDGGER